MKVFKYLLDVLSKTAVFFLFFSIFYVGYRQFVFHFSERARIVSAAKEGDEQFFKNRDIASEQINLACYFAIINKKFALADWLLRRGADINYSFDRKYTSLMKSVCFGDLKMVRYVLSHGADVHIRGKDAKTAVLFSLCSSNTEENTIKLIRYLLDYGADINDRDNMNRTVLTYAAIHKKVKVYNFLVNHGADATIRDATGKTAQEYFLSIEHKRANKQ